MTLQEIQNAHPEAYQNICTGAVNTERDRVGAWLAYHDADPKAVIEGINSGKAISATQRETLLIKMNSKQGLENLKKDSAGPIKTKETALGKTEASTEEKKLQQDLEEHLKAV